MKINTFWLLAIVIAAGAIGWAAKTLADKNKASKLMNGNGNGTGNGTGAEEETAAAA